MTTTKTTQANNVNAETSAVLTAAQKGALTRKLNKEKQTATLARRAEEAATAAAAKAEKKAAKLAAVAPTKPEIKVVSEKPLTQQELQEKQLAEFKARTGKTDADIIIQSATITEAEAAKLFHPNGYSQVTADGGKAGGYFRSLTVAALIYSGFVEMKGAIPTTTKNGNFAMLKVLLGGSAPSYWNGIGAFNKAKTGLTVIGINKVSDSLNADKGSELRAQPKIIQAMLKAFKTGGKQSIEGRTIQFYGVSAKQLAQANK